MARPKRDEHTVKVNDEFDFGWLGNCWTVRRWGNRKGRDGTLRRDVIEQTYHYDLVQACRRIVDRSAIGKDSAEAIVEGYERAARDCEAAVEKAALELRHGLDPSSHRTCPRLVE